MEEDLVTPPTKKQKRIQQQLPPAKGISEECKIKDDSQKEKENQMILA